MGGGDTTVEAPKPTAEERALQRAQADHLRRQTEILDEQRKQQAVVLPMFAKQLGYDVQVDENGNITNIQQIVDPNDQLREELETGYLERSLKALRGELEVSPALERQLEDQEETLRERLRAQFGPGFDTSSPGIEALGDFFERAESLREEARRGMMTLGEQLSMARSSFNQQADTFGMNTLRTLAVGDPRNLAGAFGQVASGYGAAQAPFIRNREMQMNANLATAQNTSSLYGAGIKAIGSILGTPAAGAAIFSDRSLKSNAIKISEDHISPIYIFDIGGEQRVGRMADEVLLSAPHAVSEQWGYKKVDYGALDG